MSPREFRLTVRELRAKMGALASQTRARHLSSMEVASAHSHLGEPIFESGHHPGRPKKYANHKLSAQYWIHGTISHGTPEDVVSRFVDVARQTVAHWAPRDETAVTAAVYHAKGLTGAGSHSVVLNIGVTSDAISGKGEAYFNRVHRALKTAFGKRVPLPKSKFIPSGHDSY